jgi:hypothetical protein
VLTASDLNNSLLQIHNNGDDLASPATKAHDMDGFQLILDGDADSGIRASTDDRIDLMLSGSNLFRFDGTIATPVNGMDFFTSTTGTAVRIVVVGSDTNVSINIVPKGSGVVQFNGVAAAGYEDANTILGVRVFG